MDRRGRAITAVAGRFMQRLGVVLFPVLSVSIVVACAPLGRPASPTLSGTFQGTSADGQPMTVTFRQKSNTVTGQGSVGAHSFSLSALAAWHGPMVLAYPDGAIKPAKVTLSPDGTTVTIHEPGKKVILRRGGTPLDVVPGPFAGRYSVVTPNVRLTLSQGGELLAGTGFLAGRPVAVVGRVTGPKRARGTLLFADESRNGVKASLSDDRQTLTVTGLGAPLHLIRE